MGEGGTLPARAPHSEIDAALAQRLERSMQPCILCAIHTEVDYIARVRARAPLARTSPLPRTHHKRVCGKQHVKRSVGVGVGIAIAVTVGVERGDIASRVREHLQQ